MILYDVIDVVLDERKISSCSAIRLLCNQYFTREMKAEVDSMHEPNLYFRSTLGIPLQSCVYI